MNTRQRGLRMSVLAFVAFALVACGNSKEPGSSTPSGDTSKAAASAPAPLTEPPAQINVSKLGQTLTVFTEITLKNHRQIDFARFLAAIEKVDQVIECHLVSGGYDYMLKFVTAGIDEYQTIMERLTDLDVGIDKYFSFVVLKSPIIKSHMPLTTLFPH